MPLKAQKTRKNRARSEYSLKEEKKSCTIRDLPRDWILSSCL